MIRSNALRIYTRQLRHVCPHKGQDMPIAVCYKRQQDIAERDYCYGCTTVDKLREKFGLRTYVRRLEIAPCKHCFDSAPIHAKEAPHLNPRISKCPGFEAVPDTGHVLIALDVQCLQWMKLDVQTGERTLYGKKLAGAPGAVNDHRDYERNEAASEANRKRRGIKIETDEEPTKRSRKK